MMKRTSLAGALVFFLAAMPGAWAQRGNRIRGPIDESRRATLRGNVSPQIARAADLGIAPDNLELGTVTLVLRVSPEQQSALDVFLAEQQNPQSPDYHRWLTPEAYADRFGASAEEIAALTAWCEQHNLRVTATSRGRNAISLQATAGDLSRAFGTEIHNYLANGRRHFANATAPQIPAAFEPVLAGIEGLSSFQPEPRSVSLEPRYTSPAGKHYLAPDDYAVLYQIAPLYERGLDGSGQSVVVVGQTQVDLKDFGAFRDRYGLATEDPELILVPGKRDPGTSSSDVGEANLDLQWTAAVARKARIRYVYSYNVIDALQYAIDQNLAPVISMSYGLCEVQASASQLNSYRTWARQASSQGITWVNASGDSGGADCSRAGSLYGGLSVDAPASVPEVTAIGGTQLDDSAGGFWDQESATNGGSLRAVVPEAVWNNSTLNDPGASGGGSSAYYPKPSWQAGEGVPNDGARDVPDISLSASPVTAGYLVQSGGSVRVFGGTSAGTPAFAGILALLNQHLVRSGAQAVPGVGNANARLYQLAQAHPEAFRDITAGDNIASITCGARARNCTSGSFGYPAGPGYDMATGLGSINAANLILAWAETSPIAKALPALSVNASPRTILAAGPVTLTATVAGTNGQAPLGRVSFAVNGRVIGSAVLIPAGSSSIATLTINGSQFGIGSGVITAEYSGDSAFGVASGSTTVSVSSSTGGPPVVTGASNAGSFRAGYAPGMLLSVFGSGFAPSTWIAESLPLPVQLAGVSVTFNGFPAPLYYVSPTQINVQIPYEVPVNSTATLTVNNNGQSSSAAIAITAAAPGIFADSNSAPVPGTRAARGSITTLFITGEGVVAPNLPSGSGPSLSTPVAKLPKPQQEVSLTVAGLPAVVHFAGIGPGLAGVTQINYQIPANAPTGKQPVIVTIGGIESAAVNLDVQ